MSGSAPGALVTYDRSTHRANSCIDRMLTTRLVTAHSATYQNCPFIPAAACTGAASASDAAKISTASVADAFSALALVTNSASHVSGGRSHGSAKERGKCPWSGRTEGRYKGEKGGNNTTPRV